MAALQNAGVYYLHADTEGSPRSLVRASRWSSTESIDKNMMSLKQHSRVEAALPTSFTRYLGNGLGIEEFRD